MEPIVYAILAGLGYLVRPNKVYMIQNMINMIKPLSKAKIQNLGNSVGASDFLKYGSMQAVKEAGRLRLEGKAYEVQDGDIIEFRFNV